MKSVSGQRRKRGGGQWTEAEQNKLTFLHPTKNFQQISNLFHVNKCSNEYKYVCVLCWTIYVSAYYLMKHYNDSHINDGKHEVTCTVGPCTELNSSLINFPIVKLHFNGKTYHCGGCSYQTIHKINIARHVKTHTVKNRCPTDGNIQLGISGAPFESKKAHFGLTLLKCNKCSFNTNCYSIYSQHISKHVEQDPTLKLLSKTAVKSKCDRNQVNVGRMSRKVVRSSANRTWKYARVSYSNIPDPRITNSPQNASIFGSTCNYRSVYRILFNHYMPSNRGRKFCNSLVKRANSLKPHISSSQKSKRGKRTEKKRLEKGIVSQGGRRCGSVQSSVIQSNKIGNWDIKKPILACPSCSYRTPKKSLLDRHIMIHSGMRPLKCPHCPFASIWHGNLSKHIKNNHSGNKRVRKLEDSKSPHVQILNKTPHKCEQCPYTTLRKEYLRKHINLEHSGKVQMSEQKGSDCFHTTRSSGIMVPDVKNVLNEDSFVCAHCNFKTARKATLIDHIVVHSEEKPHKCNQCPYTTFWLQNLNKHIKRKHSRRKILLKSTNISNRSHSIKPSRCDKSHNKMNSSPILTCPYCDYVTPTMSCFKRHFMTHSGERPLKCPYCPYACIWNGNLSKHIKNMHLGDKRVNKISNYKRLKHSSQYNSHLTTCHLDVLANKLALRPFAELSNNAKKSSLKIHISKHIEKKLHDCPHCSYQGNDKPNLAKHMLTHSGTKSYSCDRCELKFTRQGNLIAHIRRMHKAEKFSTPESTEFSSNKSSLLFIKYAYNSAQDNCLKSNVKLDDSKKKVLSKSFQCSDHTYVARPPIQASSNQKNHLSISSIKKLYECHHCQFATRRGSSLRFHIIFQHSQGDMAQVKNAASTNCSRQSNLVTDDMNAAFEEEPTFANSWLPCHRCSFLAATNLQLTEHLSSHIKPKTRKCTLCHLSYVAQSSLNRHISLKHPETELIYSEALTDMKGSIMKCSWPDKLCVL